ncbi:hypothetical protein [Nocardioides sp. InS609-2]|nr:hypothetical protein [Nocardioides sp. InS609-2]
MSEIDSVSVELSKDEALVLFEPFATNYQDLVRRARQRLLDRGGA